MAKAAKSKPPLTLDEHTALGAELHAMRQRLTAIHDDLGPRYPKRLAETVDRAHAGIMWLTEALDAVLWNERRGDADRATLDRVYYPKGEPGA